MKISQKEADYDKASQDLHAGVTAIVNVGRQAARTITVSGSLTGSLRDLDTSNNAAAKTTKVA